MTPRLSEGSHICTICELVSWNLLGISMQHLQTKSDTEWKRTEHIGVYLVDWIIENIITLKTSNTSNDDNNDILVPTILKGVETRMIKKNLSCIYGSTRTNDEASDEYHVVQWRNELYTL